MVGGTEVSLRPRNLDPTERAHLLAFLPSALHPQPSTPRAASLHHPIITRRASSKRALSTASSSPTPVMSPTQTAYEPHGFMLQLPSLGLPDPAGEWVTLRAATGTREECVALLTAWRPEEEVPLRPTETEFGTVKAQFQGAIWSIPTAHAKTGSKSELFRVKIRRQLASAVSEDVQRKRFTNDVEAVFLAKASQELKAVPLSVSQASKLEDDLCVQITGCPSDATCSLATWELLQLCANTTTAQCQPPTPPEDPTAAAQWEGNRKKVHDAAKYLWGTRANRYVNLGWFQGLRDVAMEGLDNATRDKLMEEEDPQLHLGGFIVSPEEDGDFRGIDYTLSSRDIPDVKDGGWRPMPLHGMDQEWVRCRVNLARSDTGKKLFTKEDWPPPPTTRMRKFGKKT